MYKITGYLRFCVLFWCLGFFIICSSPLNTKDVYHLFESFLTLSTPVLVFNSCCQRVVIDSHRLANLPGNRGGECTLNFRNSKGSRHPIPSFLAGIQLGRGPPRSDIRQRRTISWMQQRKMQRTIAYVVNAGRLGNINRRTRSCVFSAHALARNRVQSLQASSEI